MMRTELEIREALADLETVMDSQRSVGARPPADVIAQVMLTRWVLGDTHLAVSKLRALAHEAANNIRKAEKRRGRHGAN